MRRRLDEADHRRPHDPCECERCWWEFDAHEGWLCSSCGTGPWVCTFEVRRFHVARKAHETHLQHGAIIQPGDTYECHVIRGYYPGGRSTLELLKQLISRAA